MKHRLVSIFLLVLTCMFFAGCGIVYQSNSETMMKTLPPSAWGPLPADYQQQVKDLTESILKDPESARYHFLTPYRTTIPIDTLSPEPQPVWLVTAMVNAKNSYGGYTGEEPYFFAWSQGKLVAEKEPDLGIWIYLNK